MAAAGRRKLQGVWRAKVQVLLLAMVHLLSCRKRSCLVATSTSCRNLHVLSRPKVHLLLLSKVQVLWRRRVRRVQVSWCQDCCIQVDA